MIDKSVTIIGMGALGSLLAKGLHEKGIEIYSMFNRSTDVLRPLAEITNPVHTSAFPKAFSQLGDVTFITTPDNAIKLVASQLSELNNNFSNKIIVHCSGAKSSSALLVLKQKGAAVAAFHPVQTFTALSKPSDFNGIYFDIEGDEKAVEVLQRIAGMLEASCFEISPRAKPYLHAAGVTASNYLIALLNMAAAIAEMGGVQRQQAIKALLPLVQQTLDNAAKSDALNEALSGPVKRGDVETVVEHIELLNEEIEIQQLYKLLGRQLFKIIQESEQPEEVNQALMKLLENE